MAYRFLLLVFCLLPVALIAQSGRFFEEKNRLRTQAWHIEKNQPGTWLTGSIPGLKDLAFPTWQHLPTAPFVPVPAWSADALPFFCRVEHRWAKTARVPLKFRLGSVDYVDWLEGKRR